ncbi:MAG: enoyl-CoA hydratase-related protein [Azospirillaceae bacterium]
MTDRDPAAPPAPEATDPSAGLGAGEHRVRVAHGAGGVATVTIDRPERMNALDKPSWPALARAFRTLDADEDVRCVVLTGAGKAFSPGADVSEFEGERGDPDQAAAYGRLMEETYAAIAECRHPVLARIAGPCTGAGMVLALTCDWRIAGQSARFGAPVARLGLAMPYPEFAALHAAVGRARALEIVFEARIFDAAEAEAKGLVNRVVPDRNLDAAIAEAAERVAAGAPRVHRWHKAFARRLGTGAPLTAEEVRESYASFGTEDYREGFRAFLEKRPPVFRGR